MKKLLFNNQSFEAEQIIKSDSDIIGKDLDGNELFVFRGISDFSTFKIENEDGTISSFVSFDTIKQEKIKELNQKCNETIINGFYSTADGTKKLYDFELENQVNLSTKAYQLQIAKLAGQPITTVSYYAKGETCHDYTAEQFLKLAQDGETWKTTNIVKYKDILKPKVEACKTADEVNVITWDSVTV